MLFDIDLAKYRIVDLSGEVVPPGTEERPFKIARSLLADRAFKHDVITHTHVGTHLESPAHFFEGGRDLSAYPLDHFCGRAVVFEFSGVHAEPVDAAAFEREIGARHRNGDIVLCCNRHPDWRRVPEDRLPSLTPDGARWLVRRGTKLLTIDAHTGILLARDIAMSRENHEILMRPGVEMPILEGAGGVANLTRRECFFMAWPFLVRGIDSAWTRAVAIEER
jgi:arylformamidase